MGIVSTLGRLAWRLYQTDGVPDSGAQQPDKAEILAFVDAVDDEVLALETLVASAIEGIIWTLELIRVRSTGNVDIATGLVNGTVLNGETLVTGQHVFLGLQTLKAQNGLYTVPASGAAERATFANSAAELERIGFLIQAGTAGAGERWMLPLDAADITLGTTALEFAQISVAGVAPDLIFSTTFALSGDISPTSLSADQIDYNPTSLSSSTVIRQASSAEVRVTGLAGGFDGRMIVFRNINALGGFDILLSGESVDSIAANRFTEDARIQPGRAVLLQYDAPSSRWNVIGGQRVDTLDLHAGAELARERDWPQYPQVGEAAVPESPAYSVRAVRSTTAYRMNRRGLLESIAPNRLVHEYDPLTGEYLGWLFDPTRTNLVQWSEEFDNVYWTESRGTIDENAAVAPDGATTADKFEEDTATGAHGVNTDTIIAVIAAQHIAASCYFKAAERTQAAIVFDGDPLSDAASIIVNLTDGSVVSTDDIVEHGVEELPNGWFRVWASVLIITTGDLRVQFDTANGGVVNYAGSAGSGIYIWGGQVEVGRRSTNYIKATSATVSRTSLAVSRSALGTAKEGTLFVRCTPRSLATATQRLVSVFADANNFASISLTNGGALNFSIVADGNSLAVSSLVIAEMDQEYWLAASWRSGEQRVAVNGTVVEAGAPISDEIIGTALFAIGSQDGTSSGAAHALIKEAFYFPRAMTAVELASLTTPFSGGGTAPLSQLARRAWAGAVEDTSFKAFSDFPSTVDVQLVVSRNADMWNPVFEAAAATPTTYAGDAETYYSIVQQATGLLPDTQYYWAFRQGETLGHIRSLRTAPADGQVKSFDFLPVSCSKVFRSSEHDVFKAASAEGAAFVVHLGDFTYPVLNPGGAIAEDLGRYRDEIVRQGLCSGMHKIFENAPLGVYVPDNHDFVDGARWGQVPPQGGTRENISILCRQAYRETVPHYEFEQVRLAINAGDLDAVTLTQRFQWGRVRFLVPDMETLADPGVSHLGDGSYGYWDQLQWLYDQIDEAEADDDVAMVVLCISDVWHGINGYEAGWSAEFDAVRAYIRDNLTKQCVVICGDGHQGGADDGTNGAGDEAGFPIFMSSGIYQSTQGSDSGLGPFSWNGVVNDLTDSGSIFLFALFRVIDNGGDDIGFEMVIKSAPIDADTKEPTTRGTFRHDDDTPEVSFVDTPYAGTSGNPVTIALEKTWFGKCSVNYVCSHGPSGTINFGANKRKIEFDVTAPGGGADFTVTLSGAVGCTIGGTNPVNVVVT